LHRLTIWHSVPCNAVPALGIAQAAIDAFAELATKKTPSYTTMTLKDRPIVQLRFATAVAKVESARAYLHEAFDAAWQGALDGRSLDLAGKARLQLVSSHVPIAAAEAVDLIHSLAGTTGIRNEHAFQRHFRDAHVITQHAYVCESRMEAVGQVRFGLEPNWPFLHF
jgi:alkylation response protein AidB-like acyl-CoA dehydrogenase